MLNALTTPAGEIIRFEETDAPPPTLAPEKGLRWLPVIDTLPTPGDGEVLTGPEVIGGADAVSRVWTVVPAPVPPVPAAVSMVAARLALSAAGLSDRVDAAVAAIGADAMIAWEYATVIDRESPMLMAIAAALGWDDATVDGLFRAAAAG